jgi:AraC family transcriptional activator of pobA
MLNMKKEENTLLKLESLSDAHRLFGLPKPKHPLITIINGASNQLDMNGFRQNHVLSFYKISYKPNLHGKLKYGQSFYDFDGGGLLFAAPGQVIGSNDHEASVCSEFTLLIHPDFFLGYQIAKTIKQYCFFSYSANETLHLSDEERTTIISIFRMIEVELNSRIDDFSQHVVIAQIELLLSYANRFYKRQFITRKAASNDLLQKLEVLLNKYFNDETSLSNGLPTVSYLAEHLNLSPSYLSDMLRSLTGQNAQQHIHNKLIEKAKELLSTTRLTVAEIAYQLGFEHPQSFSKLFKTKAKLSPLEFRQSFN